MAGRLDGRTDGSSWVGGGRVDGWIRGLDGRRGVYGLKEVVNYFPAGLCCRIRLWLELAPRPALALDWVGAWGFRGGSGIKWGFVLVFWEVIGSVASSDGEHSVPGNGRVNSACGKFVE
jgi:hypothetical protein